MTAERISGPWKAVLHERSWQVQSDDGQVVASLEKTGNEEGNAKLVAASPYMLGALKALMELIGDEDLPDNGELSGEAICDMARTAIALATGDVKWPFVG